MKARLIPSLAGKHEGWPNVLKNGHMALMKAVRDVTNVGKRRRKVALECQVGSFPLFDGSALLKQVHTGGTLVAGLLGFFHWYILNAMVERVLWIRLGREP